ncbi:MAG: TylF/MycF/NovP-related O-methyltransferase [Candidatus Paceibacterota bacterium]
MVPATRMRLLHDLSRAIVREQVAGAIVECGVYNGGSAAMMVAAQPDERDVWLFDSFEGLPPPTENDGMYERNHYYPGWCGGTVEMVQEIFRTLRLPSGKQHVERGWFQETFPRVAPQVGPIALLHIDADWYDSVKICLDTFYPKVASGGYIVFDDYGTFSGCRKAVNEYFEKHKMTVTLETRDGVGRYFKKP